ncbi:MAG: adenylate cyclase [Thermoleophilaceae bacterium]|nr:adenylate cyclase [Thermoleophilaceae bacterium]
MRGLDSLLKLVDGRPDDSGSTIAQRTTRLMIPAMIGANVAGAIVVVVLALWVLPTPRLDNSGHVTLVNLIAAGVYVIVACLVGTVWGMARFREARGWLREEREPTDRELRITLRAPLRQLHVNIVLWVLAAIGFAVLNAFYSPSQALVIGVTTLLGGMTTCAIAYLLAERIDRAAFARGLEYGVPDRPVLPGVKLRALLAWALGSGVPLLGLTLVAVVDLLAGRHVGEHQLATTALGLSGVSLIVGLLVTWQAARHTAAPVLSVRDALHRVEEGDFDAHVRVFDGSELGLLQAGFNRMGAGLREREEIRDMFGRHVGGDVARAAMERGVELGGEEIDVAVLFVDLIGSTQLASEREPGEVVSLLNEFFEVVIEVVEDHDGLVNKFLGDAALAIFGAPIPNDTAAACALAAARDLARRLPDEVPDLDAGIGVSAGRAVAGNIGAESRFEYTVIGDPVNEAARLCELAKQEDARVLASAAALEAAGDEEAGRWELGDPVQLRGRSEETRPATPVPG